MDQFAQNYTKNGIVRLREIFSTKNLRCEVPKTQIELKELESIHKVNFSSELYKLCLYNQISGQDVLYIFHSMAQVNIKY